MQTIRRITIALCLFGALAISASAQGMDAAGGAAAQKSLYDRLGGLPAITAVIDDFIPRAASDTRINQMFAKTNVPRLRLHLIEQVCAATGGPCKYTGKDMKTAHKNMGVTEGEFNALVEDLVASLDKFNVPATEKGELLNILGSLKPQIVTVNTSATGTPLPANFKPAKPLSDAEIKAGPAMKSGGTTAKSKTSQY